MSLYRSLKFLFLLLVSSSLNNTIIFFPITKKEKQQIWSWMQAQGKYNMIKIVEVKWSQKELYLKYFTHNKITIWQAISHIQYLTFSRLMFRLCLPTYTTWQPSIPIMSPHTHDVLKFFHTLWSEFFQRLLRLPWIYFLLKYLLLSGWYA